MLKKRQRLSKIEFNRFFRSKLRTRSQYLEVIYTPNEELKAAVVVPKKAVRGAVTRNRLRRRVYNVLYEICVHSDTKGVFIIVVQKSAADLSAAELKDELQRSIETVTHT